LPLADDPELLHRPIGFAVGITRWGDDLDVDKQRDRLVGLLRFVRTFASELLEKEFSTTIEGYPEAARKRTTELRANLRAKGESAAEARQLLSALIDLMELEIEHEEASPEDDPEEEEEFHDAILALIGRLLERFAAWADATKRLPELTAEGTRGLELWRRAAKLLTR
jgi:hypothetical protein